MRHFNVQHKGTIAIITILQTVLFFKKPSYCHIIYSIEVHIGNLLLKKNIFKVVAYYHAHGFNAIIFASHLVKTLRHFYIGSKCEGQKLDKKILPWASQLFIIQF